MAQRASVSKSLCFVFMLLAVFCLSAVQACAEIDRSIYIPQEFDGMDLNDPSSRWCYMRSRQSDHFIVFWESAFGDDPQSSELPESMRVDVDDLLAKAEQFYHTNTAMLGFASSQKSWLDSYKMEIFLFYQEEWLAIGSGYDNVIGALWVNPEVCHPVGATLAHEIGHCFQYQVYADQLLNSMEDVGQSGFRYAYLDGLGNTFWEQCAEWQAWQDYPEEAFPWYYRDIWVRHCHRAFEHEWTRYQSYWFLYTVAQKQGAQAIGRLWRESRYPEDALAAYQRLYCGNDAHSLGEDLYDYASHAATWDFDEGWPYDDTWPNAYQTTLYPTDDGYKQIAFAQCPDEGGYNVIALDPDLKGQTVTLHFITLEEGAPLATDDPGVWYTGDEGTEVGGIMTTYHQPDENAGTIHHRYGFVALCEDSRRVYSESRNDADGTLSFDVPEDASAIYFVVVGYADVHQPHRWDNDESNDRQLPYKVKIMRQAQSAE